MSTLGFWAGYWLGEWFGAVEVPEGSISGSASISFTATGALEDGATPAPSPGVTTGGSPLGLHPIKPPRPRRRVGKLSGFVLITTRATGTLTAVDHRRSRGAREAEALLEGLL